MDPKPPQFSSKPEQEPEILSFEDFTFRDAKHNIPNYRNFFLFFLDYYEQDRYYERFKSEYPDMNSSLCEKIQSQVRKAKNRSEALKLLDRDLYEAYKIMRGYGASDLDLFS